jgi:hypothetical protein
MMKVYGIGYLKALASIRRYDRIAVDSTTIEAKR